MMQKSLDEFPGLAPLVRHLEDVARLIRPSRVNRCVHCATQTVEARCDCFCHGWPKDEWPYPDCPVCECATLLSDDNPHYDRAARRVQIANVPKSGGA